MSTPSPEAAPAAVAPVNPLDHVQLSDSSPISNRRRLERRLLSVQNLAGLGSWEWDVERNVVDWSDELYRIYGLEPGAFTATFEGYLGRLHPDDRERVQGVIGEAVRTGGRFEFEERIVRPSGEVRVLRSVGESARDSDGRVVRLLGACLDITAARAMEEDLRRSEAAYRAMFELAADAIFVHDPATGAILDANRQACELHGFTLEELREGGVALITAPDAPGAMEEARRRMVRAAQGEPQEFEWVGRDRDGRRIWVEVRLTSITMPEGARLVAVVRDITERKQAEVALQAAYDELESKVEERTAALARSNAALQRSEAHFRALIENSSDIAAILDATGTIRYESPSIEGVLGWTPEDLVGRNALEFVHQEDRGAVAAELEALLRDPFTTRRVEFRFLHRDGSYRMLESVGRGMETPELTGIVVNSRDITQRRSVEVELRLQTALLRAQGEAAIDGILVVDPGGKIVSYNQRFVQLWGIPAEIVESRSDAAAIEWVLDKVVDPDAFVRRIEHLYAYPNEDSRDEIALKDGRVLDRYSGPVRTADGIQYGRIWWFRDITDTYRFAQALEQARSEAEAAREDAERADRAKSEFLSRMSHELRTPLNSILGFAQLLQRKELAPDQVKPVEYILKGGRHLLNLINEVLEIARIESNPQALSLEPVLLSAVVQESLMLIRPVAAEQDVVIDDLSRCVEVYVLADKQRLTQVLLNLLANAVKYNIRGGKVRIRCMSQPVQLGERGRMRVMVDDTGRGIPLDKRDRIFTPFERLGAEQSGVEGTGLGLALSRRLVEAMGGTLGFETEIDVGSTFWFEVNIAESPVARLTAEKANGPRPAAAGAENRSARILYIEDNLANLSLIESVIAGRPELELISALQGSLGLELARRHRPDLILLDLHLPDLRGDEVLRRLKADARTRHIPVVMITADAMPGRADGLLVAGADSYLTKPLDLDAFFATIDRILGGREEGR